MKTYQYDIKEILFEIEVNLKKMIISNNFSLYHSIILYCYCIINVYYCSNRNVINDALYFILFTDSAH